MERQVTVYEAAQNGKVTVLENVEATTLGELKRVLVSKGIGIDNMDFMEGASNVVLRDDSTVLPTNIPYKGSTTNDLFIYLSLKNKKIASGMTRDEAYMLIKKYHLENEVKESTGRNFTQVSTPELEFIIGGFTSNNKEVPADAAKICERLAKIENAIDLLLETLYEEELLSYSQIEDIKEILNQGLDNAEKKIRSTFEDDIEEIGAKF